MRRKHKLRRLFREKTDTHGTESRNLRKQITTKIRQARDNFSNTKLEENSGNYWEIWKPVNNISFRKAFSTSANKFTIDGSDTCDTDLIDLKLNEYFSNVDKSVAEGFDDSGDNDVCLDYFSEQSHNLFNYDPFAEDFTKDLLL